ncbi:alpha/beta fold hydrolase [Pseudooceanicola sp. MF1-13]|uniref:alpha/beta fold hydrolase n=1 Tax=Pseudooceanicola sp. MF1-13 TaxID=3379095 RepID=UPI003892A306
MIWFLLIVIAAVALFPFLQERRRPTITDDARVNAPGHFAELSQGVTHYRWFGFETGPVAVCVHGLTTPGFVWDDIAQGLVAKGYRVLTYDLYGRGYSDRPDGPQADAFFIRQLEDLLADQMVADDVTLFGYSMGGAIASSFAAKHPNRLRQLVLVAPAGFGGFPTGFFRQIRNNPPFGDWLAHARFPRKHREASANLKKAYPSLSEAADQQAEQVDWAGFIPAVVSSLRGILRDMQEREHRKLAKEDMHVIAIWAANDASIPLSGMGNLTKWNRSAVQLQIEGATHWLPLTHPQEVVEAFASAAE